MIKKLQDSDLGRTLSRRELATRWSCHPLTISRHEQRGLLKPLKLGPRFLRYRLEDIERVEKDAI